MATKKQGEGAGVRKPKALTKPTLVHMVYHPEENIVGASVQQDITIMEETQRTGRDARIPIDELPADIRKHLEAAFAGVAKHIGAAAAAIAD